MSNVLSNRIPRAYAAMQRRVMIESVTNTSEESLDRSKKDTNMWHIEWSLLCSAITEWLDTGVVQVQKYPEPIRVTLLFQTNIGCIICFEGNSATNGSQTLVNSKLKPRKGDE